MAAPAHVLIVGAGIAGASAAYFAHRAGARVTLVASASGTASHVPSALVNPVRGTAGKVVRGGFEAARFTFHLIEELIERGHRIGYGRGVWRPVPDAETRERWQQQLPADEAFEWRAVDASLGLSGNWHSALYLPEAGWVETASLLDALLAESTAKRITNEVVAFDESHSGVSCLDGSVIMADRLLWCGGAMGAAVAGGGAHTFRPGSVLQLAHPLSAAALSYGIYAAPCGAAGVVGSTSEPRSAQYQDAPDNQWAIDRLSRRIAGMWHQVPPVTGTFRGVRFERQGAARIATLDGFGSRGYLLAPLAASNWARTTFTP
jgi:glycine/D-amino acid oxidase-like deaminating enzyme